MSPLQAQQPSSPLGASFLPANSCTKQGSSRHRRLLLWREENVKHSRKVDTELKKTTAGRQGALKDPSVSKGHRETSVILSTITINVTITI